VDSLVEVLRPFEILEMVRTGAVAMTRSETRDATASISGATAPKEEKSSWPKSPMTPTPICD
jgi:hypothetical protein